MLVPKYEVFLGHFGTTDVLWKGTVDGLGNAASRMKELALREPGPYFVFDLRSHQVLANIDTTPAKQHKRQAAS